MRLKKIILALSGALIIIPIGIEKSSAKKYRTNGEIAMYKLGECLATNDKAQCKRQVQFACKTIKREAFKNSYTSGSAQRAYKNADRAQRAIWETLTANLAMKKAGLGRNLCR